MEEPGGVGGGMGLSQIGMRVWEARTEGGNFHLGQHSSNRRQEGDGESG